MRAAQRSAPEPDGYTHWVTAARVHAGEGLSTGAALPAPYYTRWSPPTCG